MQTLPKKTRKPGGGRKQSWGEPTITLAFRVPLSRVDIVKEAVYRLREVPLIDIIP